MSKGQPLKEINISGRILSGPGLLLAALAAVMLLSVLFSCAPVLPPDLRGQGFDHAVNRFPTPPPSAYYFFFLANLALADGALDQGIDFLEAARKADPFTAQIDMELALIKARKNDLEAALEHAGDALVKAPEYNPARKLKADIYSSLGRTKEAASEYEIMLKKDPDNRDVQLRLSTLYLGLKEYQKAQLILTEYIASYPGSHLGFYYLGRVYLGLKELEPAEKYFQKAIELEPEFEPALGDLVDIYEKSDKLDELEKVYQRIIELNPEADRAFALLGRLYLRRGKKEEAIKLFTKVKKSYRGLEQIELTIGLIYFEQKEYELANDEFDAYLKNNPDNDQVQFYKGAALEELERFDLAKLAFMKVRPDSGYFAEARMHAAYILAQEKKLDEGVSLLKETVKEHKDDPDLYITLSAFLEENKQPENAVEVIKDALLLFPDNTRLYFRLGVIQDLRKDKAGSMASMRKVIELDPNHADALNYLAYTMAELGINLEEALVMAQKADNLNPDNGPITDTVGWVYYKLERYDEAWKFMEKAVELKTDDPVINEHLGDVLMKLELYDMAREVFLRVQELGPEDQNRLDEKLKELEDIRQ